MKIEGFPFEMIDWDNLTPMMHQGEKGYALSRTTEIGDIRVRKADYSPGFLADQWCEKGHIVLVLDGDMTLELKGLPACRLVAGMSFLIADGAEPHRASSEDGAVLFIVD